MREAINSNPMVQIAVIGVLVVIIGLFLMMSMGKKDPAATGAAPPPATAGAPAAGTTAPVTVPGSGATAGAIAPSTAGAVPSVSSESGTVTPDALIPGPGLPENVVDAWKGGDAIALLIVRGSATDDRLVRGSVESLNGDPGVAVFIARANKVARYSRITQGVGVDRAPALVVVRPRKESGSVPEATVSYGFRNSASVVQAVHDALYAGRDNLPYSPR